MSLQAELEHYFNLRCNLSDLRNPTRRFVRDSLYKIMGDLKIPPFESPKAENIYKNIYEVIEDLVGLKGLCAELDIPGEDIGLGHFLVPKGKPHRELMQKLVGAAKIKHAAQDLKEDYQHKLDDAIKRESQSLHHVRSLTATLQKRRIQIEAEKEEAERIKQQISKLKHEGMGIIKQAELKKKVLDKVKNELQQVKAKEKAEKCKYDSIRVEHEHLDQRIVKNPEELKQDETRIERILKGRRAKNKELELKITMTHDKRTLQNSLLRTIHSHAQDLGEALSLKKKLDRIEENHQKMRNLKARRGQRCDELIMEKESLTRELQDQTELTAKEKVIYMKLLEEKRRRLTELAGKQRDNEDFKRRVDEAKKQCQLRKQQFEHQQQLSRKNKDRVAQKCAEDFEKNKEMFDAWCQKLGEKLHRRFEGINLSILTGEDS